jgi:hypothetical protein
MKYYLLILLLVCSHTFLNAQTKTGFGKTWVFMVSLVEWEDTSIPSFEKDGRIDSKIIDFFKKNGIPANQILYLKDKEANTDKVRAEFVEFLKKAKKEDNLFFYYSGHGYKNDDDKVCFTTYKGADWSAEEIVSNVNTYFAGNKAFFTADCCNSGGLSLEAKKYPQREYVSLNSVVPTNKSTGNWTFSNALLYGLEGKNFIDFNNNGNISVSELAKYIDEEMAIVEGQKAFFHIPENMKNWVVTKNVPIKKNLLVGSRVMVDYDGEDYMGFVEDADVNNNFKVRFYSYTNNESEWIKLNRIKPLAFLNDYKLGEKVNALSNLDDKMYPGKVIKKFLTLHLIHFDGYDSIWDEWVDSKHIEKMK